jgi:adenylate kinase
MTGAPMHLVFMGPPGAGKGTQANLFRDRYGIPHISTGDMFRQAVRDDSEVGRRAWEYMQRGDLVPDDIVDEIVEIRLTDPDTARGFILDGYPRTLGQAGALDRLLSRRVERLHAVVFFEIREEVLLRRLTGRRVCPRCGAIYHLDHKPPRVPGRCDLDATALVQRRDDAPDTVLHRLRVFRQWTAPLVDHYRRQDLYLPVDAEGGVDDVHDGIMAFVRSRAGRGV